VNRPTYGEEYKPQVRPSTVILRRRRRNLREVHNLHVFQLLGQNVDDGVA